MFLLMFTFFIYPAEFAIETSKEGIIPQQFIAAIMAGMDFIAFLGGLSFVHIKKRLGAGIPFIISTASQKAGKAAAVTVMPMLPMALYLSQFTTPLILSAITGMIGSASLSHLLYAIAFFTALLFAVWSISIKTDSPAKHPVRQETQPARRSR